MIITELNGGSNTPDERGFEPAENSEEESNVKASLRFPTRGMTGDTNEVRGILRPDGTVGMLGVALV